MKNERILITAVRTKCWRQAKNKSAVTISYKPWFEPRFQTAETGCLKNPFNAWRARCRASHLLIDLTDTAVPAGCSLATAGLGATQSRRIRPCWPSSNMAALSMMPASHTTHTHTHLFKSPLSGTTQVSQYQKGKNQSRFHWSKRQWVALAGPYASLHLAPDR